MTLRRLLPLVLVAATVAVPASAPPAASAAAAAAPAAASAASSVAQPERRWVTLDSAPAGAGVEPPALQASAVAPAPVQVGSAPPVGRPSVTDLGFDAAPDGVLGVGSGVWVTYGDTLAFLDADGVALADPVTVTGAGDLARTPTQVLVTADAGIEVRDPDDRSLTATWTTEPCPRHPSPAGETRLFYAFGCPGVGPYGIAALNPSTGAAVTAGITDTFAAAPVLRSGGSTLVVLDGTTLHSYLVEGDGSVTPMATVTLGGTPADLALAPDGSQVAVLVGPAVIRLDTDDLQQVASYAPGVVPSAVGYSADGAHFALGLSGSTTDQLVVYQTSTGLRTSRSAQRSALTGNANPAPLAGSLVFDGDGTLLHALTQPPGQHVQLLTATAQPVLPGAVQLTLSRPRFPGDDLLVRIVTPGRAFAPVHLVLSDSSGTFVNDVTTNADGWRGLTTEVDRNGKVTVGVAADRTHGSAFAGATYRVPAVLEISLTGHSGARAGALVFRSFSRVRGLVAADPGRKLQLLVSVQQLTPRGWRTVASREAHTDDYGLLGVTVGDFDRGVRYRLTARFAGDAYNSAAAPAYSLPFLVR